MHRLHSRAHCPPSASRGADTGGPQRPGGEALGPAEPHDYYMYLLFNPQKSYRGGHFSISQRWRLGLSVTQPLGESLVVRDSNPLQTAASAHLGSYTF